ncbi:hypothetical protein UMM65_04810 [Aureibaculum sp. 2210JD6-5]|uniref:hypothetical protein n=1 Tax=Aureibaculum sp. 2210JD6-5 TaxID=3103957 RepID=UPI002AAD3491|nr:hypothetical protein [Aureibaculum sp. 2210JD6-5]MDY7394550.1 hypothetical protein [Aureibaculum sp. 2210JD6-5]
MRTDIVIKRLLFYWVSSFFLATLVYYLLWVIMPGHRVFGSLYRMFLYHWKFPILYILIPCFFYGILATLLANKFKSKNVSGKIIITILIIVLTVLISSPFGGMLWHYHDMQAGYFPENWISKMVSYGISWGFQMGWIVIGLSVPYNIIGSVICYFLTKKGIELFNDEPLDL